MSETILITGGARSGKSRFAESRAEEYPRLRGYLATAEPRDGEMTLRIDRHRARRGDDWETTEEPLDLSGALCASEGRYSVVLVDCITLWLSNLLFHHEGDVARVLGRVRELTELFPGLSTPLIMVTNEVGMGIVPEHPLARSFRDLAGEANQLIAERADQVYVCISGMPLKLK
jgi:adenosylcobinamide kinase/adenosylcobinamide-phosphate guanylyltransferase